MNRVYIIILLSISGLLFQDCSSGKKAYQRGDYYESVLKSTNRLRKSPNNKKSIETLRESYPLAVRYYEDQAQNRIDSNEPFKWKGVVQSYTYINNMYEEINRSPGALKVIPNPVDYYAKLNDAKNRAADESYVAGLRELDTGERENAKVAYRYFLEADKFVPGYKDVKEKINEALWMATLKVVVKPMPFTNRNVNVSAEFFENKFEEYVRNQNFNQFVRFFSQDEVARINLDNPDQILEISFDEFTVGQLYFKEQQVEMTNDSIVVARVDPNDYVASGSTGVGVSTGSTGTNTGTSGGNSDTNNQGNSGTFTETGNQDNSGDQGSGNTNNQGNSGTSTDTGNQGNSGNQGGGDTGNQGNQDDSGNAGNQGNQDDSGNAGNQDNSGDQGSGNTNNQGNSGTSTDTGNQGNSGNQGGGDTGNQGNQDDSGNAGNQDNSGNQGGGDTGNQGNQDNSGNTGNSGNQGNSDNQDNQGESDSNNSDNDDNSGTTGSSGKVAVCHIPPGNSGKKHTIYVSTNALDAHLGHGDTVGECVDSSKGNNSKKPKGNNSNSIAIDSGNSANLVVGGSDQANESDSLINVYGTVKATVFIYTKTLTSNGILDFRVIDSNTGGLITQEKMPGEYIWISQWANFNGDERALSDEQLQLTKVKEATPPDSQQMFVEFTKPIFDQMVQKVQNFYRRY